MGTYKVLSQHECDEIHMQLFSCREQWIPRHHITPFFTFGATSYLDKSGDNNSYNEYRDKYNSTLKHKFKGLYKNLLSALGTHLKQSVRFHPKYAYPGFHIYEAHPLFKFSLGNIHCDLQYQNLNWDIFDSVDFENPISFTLVILLPHGGGGMRIWDLNYSDLQHKTKSELKKIFNENTYQKIEYKTGWLYTHSGHYAHQISPMKNFKHGDTRITLQGHGLWCDNSWVIYW
jgi:hypothetical protein